MNEIMLFSFFRGAMTFPSVGLRETKKEKRITNVR